MEVLTKIVIEGKNMHGEIGKDENGEYTKYVVEDEKGTVVVIFYPRAKLKSV